jgi:N-acetylglutamate synthase-like GNAT family acetyltransferase
LAVAPKYQNRGIGLQLLRYCLAIADREGLPSWLTSVPGSHGFYLRLGFEDVVVRDTDLNEWDGFRYRGYGIYRSCSMKRIPRLDGDVMDGV